MSVKLGVGVLAALAVSAVANASIIPSDGSASGNTVRIEGPTGTVPEPASDWWVSHSCSAAIKRS